MNLSNFSQDLDPVCCFSGFTTLGICGCCKECTKRRDDRCGRVWMIEGKCGPDDVCLQMLPKQGKNSQVNRIAQKISSIHVYSLSRMLNIFSCFLFYFLQEGKTEDQIKNDMINDGNGTCYDKTTYQTFMTQHENKYVMQVKDGGSATDPTSIRNCTPKFREPTKFQELKNKGGYAARDGGASKCASAKLVISSIILMTMFFHIFATN